MRRRRARGSAGVEFTLTIPVIIVLIAGIELGAAGDQAREMAAQEMSQWSFLYVNGGVRKDVTRSIPSPVRPLDGTRWSSTTRSDYLPCNETVGRDDGELAGGFDDIWKEYATP